MRWFGSWKEKMNKQAQPSKKNYSVLYLVFTVGLMITGFLISPYGKVGELFVEGDSTIPDQLVLDASKITSKQTVIGTLASEKAIEAQIMASLPQVKAVTVKRTGLNDIIIKVADYQTLAYLSENNRYQSILENGMILNESLKFPMGNKPLLTKFEQGPLLNEFISGFKDISKDIHDTISEIQYMGTKTNPYKISIYMNDGNQVIANITDFSNKLAYYPDIIQKLKGKKGIIDMEVGVFFTPFNSVTEKEIDIETQTEE